MNTGLGTVRTVRTKIPAPPSRKKPPVGRKRLLTGDSAALNFLAYVRKNFPDLYSEAMKRAVKRGGLSGLGESDNGGWFDTLSDGLKKVTSTVVELAPAYLQYKTQRDLIKTNYERAKQGMPPIDSETVAPTVRVKHDADPATIDRAVHTIADRMKSDWQKPLLFGSLGLLGFALLLRFTRGNRSKRR